MKRNIFLMLIVVLMLGGLLLAEEEATFTVTVPTANIRSKAHSSAAIIGKVTAGTVLKVFGKEGDWYEVGINNKAGEEVYGFIHGTLGDVKGVEDEETEKTEMAEAKPVVAAKEEVTKARSVAPPEVKMIVKIKVQTGQRPFRARRHGRDHRPGSGRDHVGGFQRSRELVRSHRG